MSPPPTIRVDTIPEEGLSLKLALDVAWLAQVLGDAEMKPGEGPHSADLRLDLDGRDVIVSGTFATRVKASCVACLEDIELPVSAEFQLMLSPAASAKAHRAHEEVELTTGELDVDVYTDDAIDLSHWLREQILLEAPVHPRHEGDCPRPLHTTPSPNGGSERAIDPRLAPLLKLR